MEFGLAAGRLFLIFEVYIFHFHFFHLLLLYPLFVFLDWPGRGGVVCFLVVLFFVCLTQVMTYVTSRCYEEGGCYDVLVSFFFFFSLLYTPFFLLSRLGGDRPSFLLACLVMGMVLLSLGRGFLVLCLPSCG